MTMAQHHPENSTRTFADGVRHLVPGVVGRQRIIGGAAVEATSDGATVVLSNGRTMLDFGSYAVPLFGHRPATVVDAVHAALDTMPTTTRLLANPYATRLAATLAGLLDPGRLTRVWLGLNGADAVEAALKLAIAHTGHPRVLAVRNGFHGKSMGALAVTFDPVRRGPVLGFLGPVRHLPCEPDAVARAAEEGPFAALIFEPVQGEGGGNALPWELMRRWSTDAHAAGAFVIADEVQCGLRRCGPVSVSVAAGAAPDAVLLGKPLGGGVMPLSAAVCTPELFSPLVTDPFFHTTTFGGHPASCAAGLAALGLLDECSDRFELTGALLAGAVEQIATAHPDLVVRADAIGLFGVLEFASETLAGLAILEAGRHGLLLAQCLTAPTVVRLLPPVVTSPAQMATATEILDATCQALRRRTAALSASSTRS